MQARIARAWSVTIGNNGSQSWDRSYDPRAPARDLIEYLDAWFTALGPDVPPTRALDGDGITDEPGAIFLDPYPLAAPVTKPAVAIFREAGR